MTKETIVDNNYLEAFNLGYELAKELNLQSPMFNDFSSNNTRMVAVQEGVSEYIKEVIQLKSFNSKETLHLNTNSDYKTKRESGQDNDKGNHQGFDLSL